MQYFNSLTPLSLVVRERKQMFKESCIFCAASFYERQNPYLCVFIMKVESNGCPISFFKEIYWVFKRRGTNQFLWWTWSRAIISRLMNPLQAGSFQVKFLQSNLFLRGCMLTNMFASADNDVANKWHTTGTFCHCQVYALMDY